MPELELHTAPALYARRRKPQNELVAARINPREDVSGQYLFVTIEADRVHHACRQRDQRNGDIDGSNLAPEVCGAGEGGK
jgi:hypothetical protein